jgi:hypothetical protein
MTSNNWLADKPMRSTKTSFNFFQPTGWIITPFPTSILPVND